MYEKSVPKKTDLIIGMDLYIAVIIPSGDGLHALYERPDRFGDLPGQKNRKETAGEKNDRPQAQERNPGFSYRFLDVLHRHSDSNRRPLFILYINRRGDVTYLVDEIFEAQILNEFTLCSEGTIIYFFIEYQSFIDITAAVGGNIAVKKLHDCVFQFIVLRYLGNDLLDADIIEGCNVIGIEGGQILSNGIAALQEFRQDGTPASAFRQQKSS